MKLVTLVTGGARSGKSRYALQCAMRCSKKAFVATATSVDAEMEQRIRKHKEQRAGAFITVEEPIRIADAIMGLPPDTEVAVVDCLTVWLGNLLHTYGEEREDFAEIDDLLATLAAPPCDLIVVSNEVGMGIVPGNETARRFRDMAGTLNSRVAQIAAEVVFLVSGIAMTLKSREGKGKERR